MDPHPTDEQLSAALDDEDAGAQAHASSCPSCAARLAGLRAVAAAIGAPVAASDELARERAIGAAIRGGAEIPGRRRVTRAPLILGAAAALVLVLLSVPLLTKDRARDDVATLASGDESASVHGGDLGELSDPRQLSAIIGPAIGETATDGAATSTGEARDSGGQSNADEIGAERAPSATGEPPQVLRAPNRSAAEAVEPAKVPCRAETRETYGTRLGPLVYSATVTWAGTPAAVLAYEVLGATGPLNHRVFVVAQSSCTPLNILSL